MDDIIDISVIIVNHNALPCVRRALASLAGAARRYRCESIVVDNSDDPRTAEGADIWRPAENRGFGAGCNEGAALASGRLLLFLNPDAELAPGALDAAADCLLTRPGAGLVGLRTLLPDGSFEPGCLRGFPTPGRAACYYLGLERLFPRSRLCGGYHMTWLDRNVTAPVDSVSGSFLLLRAELFRRLGGFDERFFMYGEDLDLCWRVGEAGYRVWYCAEGVMLHRHGQCGVSARQTSAFYDSMLLFYDKHYARRYPRLTGALVRAAVTGKRRRALRRLEAENG